MEMLMLNLAIVFLFFWGFQSLRDRQRYRQIMANPGGQEQPVPVEELVEAFYRSDERVAEIRRYVKISKEELLGDVKSSLEEHPGQDKLLGHLKDIVEHRLGAQKVMAESKMELEEMQKMLFFASFLSAKEHILGFIYKQRYGGDYKLDMERAPAGEAHP